MNQEEPFFSDPFAGVDRLVESFVIMGSSGFSAWTRGLFPCVLISLVATAFLLQ